MVAWACSPHRMRTGGAPMRPSSSTFQPAFASTAWRAAARHVVLAAWPPVTKPTLASAGSPKRSSAHADGDLLDGGGRRRQGVERSILVPRRDQPVGGQRGGQCAADHEAEVARACGGDQAGLGAGHQRVDDGCRGLRRAPADGPPSASRTPAASTRAATGRSSRPPRNSRACCAAVDRPAVRSRMGKPYRRSAITGRTGPR